MEIATPPEQAKSRSRGPPRETQLAGLFVRECVIIILRIFKLYGFQSTGYALSGTVDHWLAGAMQSPSPLKFVKYKLNAFYSVWKGQPLPESPCPSFEDNPRVLLGGRANAWLNLVARNPGSSSLFESLLVSVLYSKKGMPRPTEQQCADEEVSTLRKLATKVELPLDPFRFVQQWADTSDVKGLPPVVLSRLTFLQQIRRTVRETYTSRYTDDHRYKPFFPSTSATYYTSRGNGGAVGAIEAEPWMRKYREVLGHEIKILSGMEDQAGAVGIQTAGFLDLYKDYYDELGRRALTEQPSAEPLGLPEALKIRVITKGPPFLNTYLKPLQKFLWSELRKCPAASLIGQPVTQSYIQDRMGKNLRWDQGFLSVDYSDATNNLTSWASEVCMDEIASVVGLTADERALAKRALTGHLLPAVWNEERIGVTEAFGHNSDGEEVEMLWQQNGQLMGSIVSFPILCILNLTVCRWAMELADERQWTLRDAPLCINGDDGLMKTSETGKGIWEKIASYIGLKPSVGKVYYSREFLNINSRTFTYVPGYKKRKVEEVWTPGRGTKPSRYVQREWAYEPVQYVNMGLLMGLKRSGGKAGAETVGSQDASYGARARALVDEAPVPLREAVLSAFIQENLAFLRSARVPWFLPESFGGLGLPCVGRYKPSDRELRLARVLLDSSISVPRPPVHCTWKVWKAAGKLLPQPVPASQLHLEYTLRAMYEGYFDEAAISEDELRSKLVVQFLFQKSKKMTDVFGDGAHNFGMASTDLHSEADKAHGYLDEIRHIWKVLYRTPVYPEPLRLDVVLAMRSTTLPTDRKYIEADPVIEREITTRLGNGDLAALVQGFLCDTVCPPQEPSASSWHFQPQRSGRSSV